MALIEFERVSKIFTHTAGPNSCGATCWIDLSSRKEMFLRSEGRFLPLGTGRKHGVIGRNGAGKSTCSAWRPACASLRKAWLRYVDVSRRCWNWARVSTPTYRAGERPAECIVAGLSEPGRAKCWKASSISPNPRLHSRSGSNLLSGMIMRLGFSVRFTWTGHPDHR